MSSSRTSKRVFDFVNPKDLANDFSVAGAAIEADYVKVSDDGYLTFDQASYAGILAERLKTVEFVCRSPASLPSGVKVFIGVADKRDADNDFANLKNACGFVIEGAAADEDIAVLAKTTISTGPTGMQSTASVDSGIMGPSGFKMLNAWQRFSLHFWEGGVSVSPPAKSKGGRGSVQARVGNGENYLRPVRTSGHLDIESYPGTLQPLVLVTGGTADLHVREVCLEYEGR